MRIISFVITLFIALTMQGEDVVIGSYHDAKGADIHKVAIRLKDDNSNIDCAFIYLSSSLGKGYFRLDGKKISEFVTALKEVEAKYPIWSDKIKEADVKKLTKEIDIKFPKVTFYLSSKLSFNFSQKPKVLFEVKDGKSRIWIFATTNTNFNRTENFSMVFDDVIGIKELITLLENEDVLLDLATTALQKSNEIDSIFQ